MSHENTTPKTKDGRGRNWAFLVYPESAPGNWLDLLDDLKVPAYVSPIHDLDVDGDGVIKKAHYHVLVAFAGKKTREQVLEVSKAVGGVGAEAVQDLRYYARYLCHLDSPHKTKYSTKDVLTFGARDYGELISSGADRRAVLREILEYIDTNDVYFFDDLVVYALRERADWYDLITEAYTLFLTSHMKSRLAKIQYLERNGNRLPSSKAVKGDTYDPLASDDL